MSDPKSRREALYDALASRILVLDGAMGTEMQRCDLHAHDFGGPEFEGCNENLVLTRPDVVLKVHREYLAAGGEGFFLGDGRLNYASEKIVELFYSLHLGGRAWLSGGYQRISNPGYNQDRGPVNFYGLRFHTNI